MRILKATGLKPENRIKTNTLSVVKWKYFELRLLQALQVF
jgi:hypothetical protein